MRAPAWLVPDWPAPAAVGALSTTRRGGASAAPYDDGNAGGGWNLGTHVGDDAQAVRSNRAMLRALLPAEPAWLSQVHGNRVVDAATVAGVPQADAAFTTQSGVVCVVQTADCLPVLFCDAAGAVVGAAHAGWRGLAGGVLENTVEAMHSAGARDLMAWLGPAIGPRSFEVGSEVRQAFEARLPDAATAFVASNTAPGKYLADLYLLARLALRRCGVDAIYGGGRCTVEEPADFYSYRRDRVTGRMASVIWLK